MGFTMQMAHWTKDMLIQQGVALKEKLDLYADDYIYQGEKGAQNGLLHFQGCLKLKKKDRCSSLANKMALPGLHLYPSVAHQDEALKNYCMKADTRIIDPVVKNPDRLEKAREEQKQAAKKQAREYKGADLPEAWCPWQQNMTYCCTVAPVDDRKIIWICDQLGSGGKTKWGKYMAWKHDAIYLSWGNTGDVCRIIQKRINAQGAPSTFIFNLTKTAPASFGKDDLYNTLEQIKDGCLCCTKYDGEVLFFDPPHCVVLANRPPDETKLSKDRFQIIWMRPQDSVPANMKKKNTPYPINWGADAPMPSVDNETLAAAADVANQGDPVAP